MKKHLETEEYIKKLKQVKLSDSSRARIKNNLLEYTRFHGAKEVSASASIPSPYFMTLSKLVGATLALVLIVGSSSLLLNKISPTGQLNINDAAIDEGMLSAPENAEESSNDGGATTETLIDSASSQTNTPPGESFDSFSRAKVAPESDSADMASDVMLMTTELSAGTWSIEDHHADVSMRIDSLRALIKKYDADIEAEIKTEFTTKLDTAATLKDESEGKPELDARANLDKASMLTGEVEATLSTLGLVEIDPNTGMIIDIDFSIDPMNMDYGEESAEGGVDAPVEDNN